MDQSIYPGNYYDYSDDEIAIQRELELGESLTGLFIDDVFPPNARSLYFDPLNPPKGSIPNESLKWYRIVDRDLYQCENPTVLLNDVSSVDIKQGAIGNSYLINAMSLLACQDKFIKRIIVSSKYASKGLYTLKFFKAGKWRYVHIDDFIPCRQSGKVHFCRNANPNEIFAMLIEKAYAKLHGCYEAISYGLIEKVLEELTPAAGIQCIRTDKIPRKELCDKIWEYMEGCMNNNSIIGCGRFIADPMGENPSIRQGISLGKLYQVVDIVVTNAESTEDFDALTIGMVCIRNLQGNSGRFTGRWSFGDRLWFDYKEIALDLRHRTREIQHKRGLGPHPNDEDDNRMDARNITKSYVDDNEDDNDEPDDLDTTYIEKKSLQKIIQPMADDLHWIQIEDFVEIFNRLYLISDLTFDKRGKTKRFLSKWLPGDFIVGSGGPPVIVTKEVIHAEENEDEDADDVEGEAKSHKTPELIYKKIATINENFTDNPMFPFSVSEPTEVAITLYQYDKRWNIGRLGEKQTEVNVKSFVSRKERLESVMKHSVGIAFLVVRLSGLKVRLTEFKLKKIAFTSGNLVFSHSVTGFYKMSPGRYAVIPYTHSALDRIMDYALHFQYLNTFLEFEIEDPIAQRLQDKEPSEEGLGDAEEPDDNDLLQPHEEDDDVSVLSFEKVKTAEDLQEEEEMSQASASGTPPQVPLPKLLVYNHWEYAEDIEELAVNSLFTEVGDMMKYLKSLKGEIRKLNATIRATTATESKLPESAPNKSKSSFPEVETKDINIISNPRRY